MYFKSIDDLKDYIEGTSFSSSEQLMVMVGDKSADMVADIIAYLNKKSVSFFGGIFPEIIVGNKNRQEGFIVELLKPVYSSLVMPLEIIDIHDIEKVHGATAIIFVDGLSSRMKDLTDAVYDKLGDMVTYAGGGAGFYDMQHRPCIFNNDQIYKDALYICIIENKSQLAVEHGWETMSGPFTVKKSYNNIIADLNGCRAFDVYRHVIEKKENLTLFKDDFFIYAKDHPFGILEDDGSLIVRDPIAVNDDDEIICVAGISEGSDVYIMKGDTDTLLRSSLKITEDCRKNAPPKYLPLLFDCISRAMFLERHFSEELDNIQSNLSYSVEGALSIGEIACKKSGELVIHNKSAVLVLLES